MDNVFLRESQHISSETGSLYVLEGDSLPFCVERVYYITNVKKSDIIRGKHAHKELQQLLICLGGSCEILLDDGVNRETIILDDPGIALYIKPCIWREISIMNEKATLMVLASDTYDEGDYIRSYEDFKEYIRGLR